MYLDTHLCTHTMHSHNLYTHLNTHLHLHTCTHTVDHAHFIWTLRHIRTATNPRYIHLPLPTQPVSVHTHTHTHTHTHAHTAIHCSVCTKRQGAQWSGATMGSCVTGTEVHIYTHTLHAHYTHTHYTYTLYTHTTHTHFYTHIPITQLPTVASLHSTPSTHVCMHTYTNIHTHTHPASSSRACSFHWGHL